MSISEPPPEVNEAERWWREADEELRAAIVIAEHPDLPDRVAGFHAHLAAEKSLKALLIFRGVRVPRIHDLVSLRGLLPAVDQLLFADDDLEVLNPWSIEGRYPADLPEAGSAELASVLRAAHTVRELTRAAGSGAA